MLSTVTLSTAIFAYSLSTLVMMRSILGNQQQMHLNNRIAIVSAVVGLVVHLMYLSLAFTEQGSVDFSLSSMAILMSAILMLIFLVGCLGLQIERLGVLVFPLTAMSLAFSALWSGEETRLSSQALLPLSAFSSHVLLAVLAYSLLTMATVQALLYAYLEKQFKNRTSPAMLASLPPLQTMEKLLFRLTVMGFFMLTLTLISGVFFSQQIFGKPFSFDHKTVLSVLGWLTYATMLVKRLKTGLRGSQAVIWSVAGFMLIQLGYIGTKFILESLNL